VASFTLQFPSPWGKSPWCPLNGRVVGPQNWPGLLWELNYDSSVVWPIAYSGFHEQTFKNLKHHSKACVACG